MSKSKGNIVVPWEVIDRFGADAFRWYFFTSKQPWDGYRFSTEAVGEGVRLFLKQLWNTYAFLHDSTRVEEDGDGEQTELDRWILSRLSGDGRGGHRAPRRLRRDVRRPRDRGLRRRPLQLVRAALAPALLGRATPRAFATLRDVPGDGRRSCSRRSRRSSPTRSTTGSTAASRRCTSATGPRPGARDVALEDDMAIAREAVRLGLGARGAAKVKLRQPLREAVVVAAGRERDAIERARRRRARGAERQGRCASSPRADELGSYELKAELPHARAALRQGDAAGRRRDRGARRRRTSRRRCATGGTVGVNVDGHEHELDRRRPAAARCSRSRATRSSARARTPSRSTSRSTTSCAARGSRARSCARCRTRARTPASRSPTGSR